MIVHAKCVVCGKEFEYEQKKNNGYKKKYCSPECRKSSYSNRNGLKTDLTDYIGKTFGEWTILEESPSVNGKTYVKARCSCGVEREVLWQNIKSGKSTSCGHRKYGTGNRAIDETGNQYGELTVLRLVPENELSEKQKASKNLFWECQCSCGNKIIVSGARLRFGVVKSCGCVQSQGERLISRILTDNNISFAKEVTFSELRDQAPLRFDFGIYDNGRLVYLIEMDGVQHFKPRGFGSKTPEKNFELVQKHDKQKNEFCKQRKIPLIRVPYTALETLTMEDLSLSSQYLK